ncbi:MAG: endolytic transglycosylase MltG [Campylobacterota bacterium]
MRNRLKEISKNFIKYSVFFIGITLLFYVIQPVKTTKVVFVPQGSINAIIHHLRDNGFNTTWLDSFIIRFLGHPQSGWINVGQNTLSRLDFLYKLTTAKAAIEPVTMVPGKTKEIFFYELSQKLDLDIQKLLAAYEAQSSFADGAILADTYHLPKGISEPHLVRYLLDMSRQRHKQMANRIFGRFDEQKWYKYLIVASIIQKEAANKEEMPKVASVVYNRLQRGMKLQMDGTLNYGVYGHQKVTPERIKNDTSAYNTYKHKGLPPNPVGSVSIDAIKAAINPARTQYLYFVRGSGGTHLFAKTYKQHLRNIRN